MKRGRATWLAFAIAVAAIAGCKPHAGARAPRRDVSGMDADAIDRELAANQADLEAAGIWIPPPPAATTVDAGQAPPSETPREAEEDAPDLTTEAEAMEPAREPEPPASPVERKRMKSRSFSFGERRSSRREDADRCARICDLAEVTCDLQAQICALAERHPHDVRYEDACVRAQLQCDAASRECDLCSEE